MAPAYRSQTTPQQYFVTNTTLNTVYPCVTVRHVLARVLSLISVTDGSFVRGKIPHAVTSSSHVRYNLEMPGVRSCRRVEMEGEWTGEPSQEQQRNNGGTPCRKWEPWIERT